MHGHFRIWIMSGILLLVVEVFLSLLSERPLGELCPRASCFLNLLLLPRSGCDIQFLHNGRELEITQWTWSSVGTGDYWKPTDTSVSWVLEEKNWVETGRAAEAGRQLKEECMSEGGSESVTGRKLGSLISNADFFQCLTCCEVFPCTSYAFSQFNPCGLF